jgi:hypothetical protein
VLLQVLGCFTIVLAFNLVVMKRLFVFDQEC